MVEFRSRKDGTHYPLNKLKVRRGCMPEYNPSYHGSSIQYAGRCLDFNQEVESIDEAQALLDFFRSGGLEAACTHHDNKHQVYVEPRTHSIDIEATSKAEAVRLFLSHYPEHKKIGRGSVFQPHKGEVGWENTWRVFGSKVR